ncbi:MAG: hypothetical protein PHQ87_15840 [Hydrogenophaga sp.]|uniref:hypothetical protein n=1 Tax=Hydrogenophaga sp. TaxID=1904254 RepID=UPI0026265928|nr:hypothetical protein [Hydrogenophaga sp.]MDD3787018.1 hypothetical protein [Hydrogenophaga sp.]
MPSLKAIVPDRMPVDAKRMRRELEAAINKTLDAVRSDFRRTVRTWKEQPVFVLVKARAVGAHLEGEVHTTNEIYRYVTRGTRPHPIVAKNAARLLFKSSGFLPKTHRRVIGSGRGREGSGWATADAVDHPGTEAREFEEEIAARKQRNLENAVTAAVLRAVKGR